MICVFLSRSGLLASKRELAMCYSSAVTGWHQFWEHGDDAEVGVVGKRWTLFLPFSYLRGVRHGQNCISSASFHVKEWFRARSPNLVFFFVLFLLSPTDFIESLRLVRLMPHQTDTWVCLLLCASEGELAPCYCVITETPPRRRLSQSCTKNTITSFVKWQRRV